jgi:hypothetical protein
MNWIRDFSAHEGHVPQTRNVEDAPQPMRQELVDAIYLVTGQTEGRLDADHDLYFTMIQSLGYEAAGNPHAGRRQRIGRDISSQQTHWTRIYDLIARLWPEFQRVGFHEIYREVVNRILAGHAVAWDLGEDGRLHRVLPEAAHLQVQAAITELSDPRYAPAGALFRAASDAYDDRPRRDRDACSNIFDAMESVAKEKFGMPAATFGQVVTHIRRRQGMNEQIIGLLEALNSLRNRNFGHGMIAPFSLTGPEVDFTYLSCIGAILLLARTP